MHCYGIGVTKFLLYPLLLTRGLKFKVSLGPAMCCSHPYEAQGKTASVVLGSLLYSSQALVQSHSLSAMLWVL